MTAIALIRLRGEPPLRRRIRAPCSWLRAAVLLPLGVAGVANATPSDGYAAFAAGDYASARALLTRAGEAGDALAAAALGVMPARGLGAPADGVDAIEWYTRAASAGLIDAQTDLAAHYYRGELVPRDVARARYWWNAAAQAGDARARTNLALLDRDSPPPGPAARKPEPAPAPSGRELNGSEWVLAQPPEHYTVQLASGDDAAAIQRFLRAQPFVAESAYFSVTAGQSSRHTAIVGTYSDVGAARAALAGLPQAVKERAPWIRRFGDIQAQIRTP